MTIKKLKRRATPREKFEAKRPRKVKLEEKTEDRSENKPEISPSKEVPPTKQEISEIEAAEVALQTESLPLPEDPIARAQVLAGRSVIEKARLRIAKHKVALYRDLHESKGPNGEKRSEILVRDVELVPLERIVPDPDFVNLRLPPTEDEAEYLEQSMQSEGLKVPIELIPSLDRQHYHVRCGFRREKAARKLGWGNIPAIVIPFDTPKADEYWTNIIENSARDRLTTYEIASAARTMREKFGVKAREFATRAGYSETYVVQLLRCIDKLPEEIVEIWKGRAPIPVRLYDQWTGLTKEEAISAMNIYRGRNPTVVGDWRPPPEMRKKTPLRMLTSAGLARIQRMRFAVEVARALNERERDLCLSIVDFCSGVRDDVGYGVLKNGQKLRIYKSRRKEDLEMEEEAPEVLDQAWFNDRVMRQGGIEGMMKQSAELQKLIDQYQEQLKKNGGKSP